MLFSILVVCLLFCSCVSWNTLGLQAKWWKGIFIQSIVTVTHIEETERHTPLGLNMLTGGDDRSQLRRAHATGQRRVLFKRVRIIQHHATLSLWSRSFWCKIIPDARTWLRLNDGQVYLCRRDGGSGGSFCFARHDANGRFRLDLCNFTHSCLMYLFFSF